MARLAHFALRSMGSICAGSATAKASRAKYVIKTPTRLCYTPAAQGVVRVSRATRPCETRKADGSISQIPAKGILTEAVHRNSHRFDSSHLGGRSIGANRA